MPQLAYPNSNLSLTRPQASFRPVKPLGPSAPSSGPAGPDRHHPSDSATSAGPTHRRAAAPHAAATLPGRLSGLPWRVSRAARSAHSRPSGGGSGPQPGRVSRGSTALSPSPALSPSARRPAATPCSSPRPRGGRTRRRFSPQGPAAACLRTVWQTWPRRDPARPGCATPPSVAPP